MTVHDFVASFALGEVKKIPNNCTADDLIDYGKKRFNIVLIREGESLKRVCPYCHR